MFNDMRCFAMKDIGDVYFQETKYDRESLGKGSLDWNNKPEIYKCYPDCKAIKLPDFNVESNVSFLELLKKRKSIRSYSSKPLELEKLSFLLWASTGIQRIEYGYEFRTAPSAGALYPIETYLIINNVSELDQGIYHYNIEKHSLEFLKKGNFKREIALAALHQYFLSEAPVVFIWSAIFQRSKWKYKERAYRYIFIDVGHIAQNLALAAVYLNLGSCQVGAFFDDEVNNLIGIDGINESVIYLSSVGYSY